MSMCVYTVNIAELVNITKMQWLASYLVVQYSAILHAYGLVSNPTTHEKYEEAMARNCSHSSCSSLSIMLITQH